MKSFKIFSLIFGLTLTGCGSVYDENQENITVVGGYTSVDTNRNDVVEAAQFASNKIGRGNLDIILNAQIQIIAGTNYKLTILLENGEVYNVVVYKDFNNNFNLTSSNFSYHNQEEEI